MTGLHGKRLGRSSSKAAAAAPLPPPKRSHSLPASSSDQGPMDVTAAVAPPPPARAKAPAPLPKRESSVPADCPPPTTAYVLRNRRVPDTSNSTPTRDEEREELKHDPSCSSRTEAKEDELSQAPACARVGLEHYNSMNQGDEHELVKAVDVHSFVCCGMWLHANFLARRKGANNCVDLVPKYFFAELNLDGFGLLCASCVKIDSVESKNLGGCGMCPGKIRHPADGTYLGAQACRGPAASGGLEVAFSF
ncbi:uncharacterized protein LOC124691033 [Lolium rigidum]|uniref:uncharacterized protein LOC124691033 n=1 Tax=Lolium rigidum TaxID=89674 RepID=UPI001F5CA515|nr:uncharacterized protein LOC124691033 [Lolium rigidum]